MRIVSLKALVLTFALAATSWLSPSASGQAAQQIFGFGATWRYNTNGALPAANWMAPAYVDTAWGSGAGVLGFDGGESLTFGGITYGTMMTILPRFLPNGSTTQILTYYFRGRFTYNGSPAGVTLVLTNVLDDGAVIYLNGVEVGRFGMPAGAVGYATSAVTRGGDEFAGRGPDVLTINSQNLIQGLNVIAVEVHQVGTGSSDLVFGMSATAQMPSQLTITQQPQSQTVSAPAPVTLSVGVSGGPVFYQWQKDQVDIFGATTATYTINSPSTVDKSGTYRVRVYNSVSSLFSSNAVVTINQDTAGPIMVTAILQDLGSTNQIDVTFDEAVTPTSVNATNVQVIRSGTYGATAVSVTVSNVTVNGKAARLRVGGPNWNFRTNYYVLANRVTDATGNYIAPNSVIGMSTQSRTNMAQISDQWRVYDLIADPDRENTHTNFGPNAWFRPTYVEDPNFWAPGGGIFTAITSDPTNYICAGDRSGSDISYYTPPALFRRELQLPAGFGTSGKVTFRHIVDDGLVLYLNGQEIYRWNMPAPLGGPLNWLSTRAVASFPNTPAGLCVTGLELTITNFLIGPNLLGAAVYQSGDAESDTVFGLEIDAVFPRTGSMLLTNGPAANLRMTAAKVGNDLKLTWPDSGLNIYYGYILEETSTLTKPPSNIVWRAVSNGTNGAILSGPGPRFIRLRKGPNSP